MILLDMKKTFPRYRNNIFVKAENHLTRTINTYIEYEKVIKIYLSFNFKEDKYELHLKIDREDLALPDNVILIYDREIALNNRKTMSTIFNILNSNDITELFKNGDIERLKELVKKYSNKKTDFCDIFDKPSDKIISSIQDFIKIKGHYVQKKSKENEKSKKIDINKMVAKRIYNYVLNRLNYSKEYFTEFSRLKNKHINKKLLRENFVKNEIENIMYKIKLINEIKNKDYSIFEIESLSSYKDIIIGLELFDNVDFNLSKLTTLKTKEELLYEKSLIETNIDLYNKEANIMNELEYKLKETLSIEFYDYIKLKIFTKNKKDEKDRKYREKAKKDKNNEKTKNDRAKKELYTTSTILSQLDDFIERNEWLKTTRGRKRKELLIQFKKLFGINFREYNDRIRKLKYGKKEEIKKLSEEEKKIKHENYIKFIYLLYKMNKLENILTIFRKRELFDIFNEKYFPKEKNSTVFLKETTLEEIKIEDSYHTLIQSYYNILDMIPHSEYEEYDNLTKESYLIKQQLDLLTDKYKKISIHPFAQKYLDEKEKNLQNEYDDSQEKDLEQWFEELEEKQWFENEISLIRHWSTFPFGHIKFFPQHPFFDLIFANIKIKELRFLRKKELEEMTF